MVLVPQLLWFWLNRAARWPLSFGEALGNTQNELSFRGASSYSGSLLPVVRPFLWSFTRRAVTFLPRCFTNTATPDSSLARFTETEGGSVAASFDVSGEHVPPDVTRQRSEAIRDAVLTFLQLLNEFDSGEHDSGVRMT